MTVKYGCCPECGGSGFPSKIGGIFKCAYCGTLAPVPAGKVNCGECETPIEHEEHGRIRAEMKRAAYEASKPVSSNPAPVVLSSPTPQPVEKKRGRSVLEKVAIAWGIYMVLSLICSTLGVFPVLIFSSTADSDPSAMAGLLVTLAILAGAPLAIALVILVRSLRKKEGETPAVKTAQNTGGGIERRSLGNRVLSVPFGWIGITLIVLALVADPITSPSWVPGVKMTVGWLGIYLLPTSLLFRAIRKWGLAGVIVVAIVVSVLVLILRLGDVLFPLIGMG